MRRFAWGIVGFGWVAQDFVAPAMDAAGQAIVAVFDPSPSARDAASARGATLHADLAAFATDPAIDAIYVATPNHLHRVAVEAALAAGRPVLCEKPIAATVAEAEAMVRSARRSGVFCRIAFDQRHHPAHLAIREAIDAGRVGTVSAVRIVYACWLGRDWRAPRGDADNWRVDPHRAGGGALIDLAPHGVDLVSYLCGEPIVAIDAMLQRRVHRYEVDDGAVVGLRTASGILASLHVAYNQPETLLRRRLEVSGTDGLISAIDTMGQEAGGTVVLEAARAGAEPEALVFDRSTSPFVRQVEAFARSVREGAPFADALEVDLEHFRLLARAEERTGCH